MRILPIVIFAALCSWAAAEEKPKVGPEKGTLIIMGGGGKEFASVFDRFVELAGGEKAKIVIVPTAASSDPKYRYDRSWSARYAKDKLKVASAVVLHTHDRKEADTAEFVKSLKDATGVWFGGGRQWRLTKAYGGTKSEEEFHKVLARGGVIGGSSAGATIQGSFLARGDTSGNTIMIGDVQRGFGFLRNSAIDQHLIARGREKDLIEVLEDPKGIMRPEFSRKELLGIGIDEDVAIEVTGDRFKVIGKKEGQTLVYDPKKWTKGMKPEEKWVVIREGEGYDLKKRVKIKAN